MHPGARRRSTWLRAIALAYALFLALIELSRRVGLLAFAIDRRLALVLALCVLGPLMGLAVVFKRATAPPEQRLRVMTYNVKYGLGDMRGVAAEILAADPDLLLLQDVGSRVTTYPPLAKFLRTRHVEAEGFYLVASRYPLSPMDYRPMGPDWYVRTRIEDARFPVAVYNVHLMTPRDGLQEMRAWSVDAVDEIMSSAAARLAQVDQLNRDLDRESGPVLLAGDLNAPPESLVLRRLRSTRLQDAFGAAGLRLHVWPHAAASVVVHASGPHPLQPRLRRARQPGRRRRRLGAPSGRGRPGVSRTLSGSSRFRALP